MGNAREIRRSDALPSPIEPPALPPRPTVDSAAGSSSLMENQDAGSSNCSPCSKKYVLLCAACGGLAIILGSLFAVLYVILRSYTSSLHYFETVPSYVAAVSLIVTGLLMLCFGWRRNRFGYLVKLCGACCLLCAVVCVVITVTTTVVHMNRLQTLRECVYNARGRSCTCFTGSSVGQTLSAAQQQAAAAGLLSIVDPALDQGSARYIFADTPDCEVVHGALYACLRALFGLSVIGILVSLFSGMLVYQLLGHERKKMYWEQLELRSRALIRRHHPAPCCGCCQECRFAPNSNNPMLAWPAWDVLDDSRYWGLHGGNLYSPGPCANGTTAAGSGAASVTCTGQGHGVGTSPGACPAHRRPSGNPAWNWLPWRPAVSDSSDITSANRTRRAGNETGPVVIGPDDHYGFPLSSNNSNYRSPLALTAVAAGVQERVPAVAATVGWGPPPPYSRGSTSELGSISASTPMGSLSPAHRSPQSVKTSSSPSTAGSATCLSKDNSLRKDHPVFASNNLRQTKPGLHQSPVGRMNVDPRRMPWSAQTVGIAPVGPFPISRNMPAPQTGSPSGRMDGTNGKILPESELYFGDTSSYTVSVNNDGSNSSAMYEEIQGHRYDKIQRPVAKVTSIRSSAGGGKPSQRSSWDGQNQRAPVGVHGVPGGQPRSRHSADTVGKEKMFSPIALPKFNSVQQVQQANWLPAGQPDMIADTCSFVPYRRAAVVPATGGNDARFPDGPEVYENVTNLDFDEKKPRTLSPDEEVAILTSQFHGSMPPVEQEAGTQMDSESDDNDSMMRAVNV